MFGKTKNKTSEQTPNGEKKETKKSKKFIPKTMQEVLNFSGITDDGIIVSGVNSFSKLYHLTDSNYVTEGEEEQERIADLYVKLINRFPTEVTLSVIIVNEKCTKEEIVEAYHIKKRNDGFDSIREEYNSIIDKKLAERSEERTKIEGDFFVEKKMYIMLSVRARSLKEAETSLSSAEIALNESVKLINVVGVTALTALERATLINQILCGKEGIPYEKEYEKFIETTTDEDGREHKMFSQKLLRKSGMSFKDTLVPQRMEKSTRSVILGGDEKDRYFRGMCIRNFPERMDTEFVTKLTNFPYEMVTVIEFSAVAKKKATVMVKNAMVSAKAEKIKQVKNAYRNNYSPDLINEDVIKMVDDIAQVRDDVVNQGKKLYYTKMVVGFFGESLDELDEIGKAYQTKCEDYSIRASYLDGQQYDALNTCLLLGKSTINIDRLFTSDDTRALFPFSIQELSDRHGHFYGMNSVSKNMIMFNRKGREQKNSNGLIFGMSGSGKSFITKGEIIPNFLDSDDDIIILDPENEYREIANKFGGMVVDLELKADVHINPCDLSMEWDDRKASPLATKCDFMVGIVESILGKGRECNSYEISAINRACNRMYAPYIEEMTRRKKEGEPNNEIDTELCPTLVDFYNCLREDATPESTKVAQGIEPYCVGNWNLFAHKTNVKKKSRLIVYCLRDLPEKMQEMAMKVCLTDIWNKIIRNGDENREKHTNHSIWVYLDEFHHFFKSTSTAKSLKDIFKRARKFGGIMTGITQDVSDLLSSSEGVGMFSNTGFFIFLNQSPIGIDQLQRLYSKSLTDTLADFIREKPQGTGLIYNTKVMIPFNYRLEHNTELYRIMSTNPNDNVKKPETERPVDDTVVADDNYRNSPEELLDEKAGYSIRRESGANSVVAKANAVSEDGTFDL